VQNILNFFIKHNHWFLFILLEGISIVLIVSFNNYQSAAVFTSANSVVGKIYSTITDVEDYFTLEEKNEALVSHNKALLEEVESLKKTIAAYEEKVLLTELPVFSDKKGYYYNVARVVNMSPDEGNCFITVDKGTDEGIEPEMGVFNDKGVVGITYTSSGGYSLVLPLVNGESSLSCKIKGTDNFCSLKWDGKDKRYSHLIDMPRQTGFGIGDTVVTSGYSPVFPEGIPVGRIEQLDESNDGLFFMAKVELFVDFTAVDNVFIVGNASKKEQTELEKRIKEE
jgi:rod shape-determining protein MreC